VFLQKEYEKTFSEFKSMSVKNLQYTYKRKLVYQSKQHNITTKQPYLKTYRLKSCVKTPIFVATIPFCNYFCEKVHSGEVNPLPTYIIDEITTVT